MPGNSSSIWARPVDASEVMRLRFGSPRHLHNALVGFELEDRAA